MIGNLKWVVLPCCFIFVMACGKKSKVAVHNETNAEKAVICFEKRHVDMGTISVEDSCCVVAFSFTNTGSAPLILAKLKTSCSCLVSDYSKKPVNPGDRGEIRIKLLTEGKKGHFNKSVYVKSNAVNDYEVLYVKGVVN